MSNPMTGHNQDDQLEKIIEDLRHNAGYLNQLDFKVLEFLSTKPMYEENQALIHKADYVPYISEVEEFNKAFNKPNNYEPVVPERKDWKFVYEFIKEELEEYKEACENGDIVEVLDALGDITYVATGNGVMLHGLKDKFQPAYAEIHASNMSKICKDETTAALTLEKRQAEQGEPCHVEPYGKKFIVYRSRDRKVMKSVDYFRPNLKKFFNDEK